MLNSGNSNLILLSEPHQFGRVLFQNEMVVKYPDWAGVKKNSDILLILNNIWANWAGRFKVGITFDNRIS
jgi:hypothetical protein